jgi:hypothetical protein
MLGRLKRVVTAPLVKYNDLLERRPLLTKSITTGVMYGGGDVLAQYVEHMQEEDKDNKDWFNGKRTFVFAMFGTIVGGPAFHYWYDYLSEIPGLLWQLKKSRQRGKILRSYAFLKSHGIEVKLDVAKLPKTAPLGKWQNKIVKLFADQVIFASAYLLVFFMGVGTMTKAVERAEVLVRSPEVAGNPKGSPAETAELMNTLKTNNPVVADLITQLQERITDTEEQMGDVDDELRHQYALINQILQKIHQVTVSLLLLVLLGNGTRRQQSPAIRFLIFATTARRCVL